MHYKRSLQCSPKKKKTLLQIRVLREKWSSKPPQLLCNHRKTQLKHCIWSWNIECYVALLESCKSEFSTLKKKYTSRERGPQWTPCVKNTKCFFCFYSSHLFDFYLFQSVFFFFSDVFVPDTWMGHKGLLLTPVLTVNPLTSHQWE